MIAYNNNFQMLMYFCLASIPLVLLLRKAGARRRRAGDHRMSTQYTEEVRYFFGRNCALVCFVIVGGCAVGPNFTRPVPPAAARYTPKLLTRTVARLKARRNRLRLGATSRAIGGICSVPTPSEESSNKR